MRIRSFHIDAFGTLRDVTVEGLPEAGAVFLGHNEAGKSTLLDFFRVSCGAIRVARRQPDVVFGCARR